MTVKLKYCIYLSSFSVWLALSNQIASAQKINPLPKERYQNYTDYKSDNKQNSFTIKNTFREKLKEKFKNYVVESNNQASTEQQLSDQFSSVSQKIRKGKSIRNAINKLNAAKELNDNDSKLSKLNSEYILPPTIAAQEKIHPFTTTLPLNGIPISHLTEWELYTGATFGDDTNTSISAGGIVKIDGRIIESLTKDNIYTVDQKGSYLQLQRIRETREVAVTRNEPHTMLGMQMQMSFTASC